VVRRKAWGKENIAATNDSRIGQTNCRQRSAGGKGVSCAMEG